MARAPNLERQMSENIANLENETCQDQSGVGKGRGRFPFPNFPV